MCTGGAARPALVVWPSLPGVVDRLARAGFAVVTIDVPAAPGAMDAVLSALGSGALGPVPPAVGLLALGAGGLDVAAHRGRLAAVVVWTAAYSEATPGASGGQLTLTVSPPWVIGGAGFDRALDETIRWLATRLA